MSKEGKLNKINLSVIRDMKSRNEKIAMITAYDYPTAKIVDEAGVDIILVGDSLGMVVLGYDSTLPVTMEDMIHHTKAAVRGTERAMVIVDMPFMSYQVSCEEALQNAGRLMKESGAHGVKLEGGREIADTIRKIVAAGIPVMAHLGLTPQSVHQLGGYKVQGKKEPEAKRMMEDAAIVQEAGAFLLILECVPVKLAFEITASLDIPTVGIGAGVGCDGQVLVLHDMLGFYDRFVPKFVKKYAALSDNVRSAVNQYVKEVKESTFPDDAHSFR
ncbi:MAG: 3-methyl-2-oxobutanoate hydroxymethyltransferase [Deltaproteobacteria bacterium]|nr:3-methyl-2-oxobutanoate hydroxymethyltransferase [Deltaproteobacteria bacterium]